MIAGHAPRKPQRTNYPYPQNYRFVVLPVFGSSATL